MEDARYSYLFMILKYASSSAKMEWMHPSTFLHKVKTLNINVNYILKIGDKRCINLSYNYRI